MEFNKKQKPNPQYLRVNTEESASKEQLADNIIQNYDLQKQHIKYRHTPHEGHILLVSAGSSFTKNPKIVDEIVKKDPTITHVSCVKHCLPHFKGIKRKPDFCVTLDPRPLEEESTLGTKRLELFKNIYEETVYLIATMTHPSVTEYLFEKGAKVVHWNSACAALEEPGIPELVRTCIQLGSNSAMRSFVLFQTLGFKKISLVGYDSTVEKVDDLFAKDKNGQPKYIEVGFKDKRYITTLELAAQINDIEDVLRTVKDDIELTNYSGGVCAEAFEVHRADFEKEWGSWKDQK